MHDMMHQATGFDLGSLFALGNVIPAVGGLGALGFAFAFGAALLAAVLTLVNLF